MKEIIKQQLKKLIPNRGTTRLCLVLETFNIVVKFTNPRSQKSFLLGCLSNINERKITKNHYDNYKSLYHNKIAKTYYSSWFGLFSIQEYVHILTPGPLRDEISNEDRLYFQMVTQDFNPRNFGYVFSSDIDSDTCKLVCVDYGVKIGISYV